MQNAVAARVRKEWECPWYYLPCGRTARSIAAAGEKRKSHKPMCCRFLPHVCVVPNLFIYTGSPLYAYTLRILFTLCCVWRIYRSVANWRNFERENSDHTDIEVQCPDVVQFLAPKLFEKKRVFQTGLLRKPLFFHPIHTHNTALYKIYAHIYYVFYCFLFFCEYGVCMQHVRVHSCLENGDYLDDS